MNTVFDYEEKSRKYGKKYNLKENSDYPGWNDEIDAFRHAFMQALLYLNIGEKSAKFIGDSYENIAGFIQGQSSGEKNMDLWNNKIGREIGKEIRKELKGKKLSQQVIEDMVADKVIQRMRNGQLITDPADKRKFGGFTGFASDIRNGIDAIPTSCVGSYPVSGYTRNDGTKVSAYIRTCGAKHSKIPKLNNLSKEEIDELMKKYI